MKADPQKLIEQVQRVGNGLDALKKGPLFRHDGVRLYSSEIHMMNTVASNPELNASGLAEILGVTKGAVSQTLSRLERKGIFRKENEPGTRNELRVLLTSFGQESLAAFHEGFADQWSGFKGFIESLSEEERRVVGIFLARLESFLRSLR